MPCSLAIGDVIKRRFWLSAAAVTMAAAAFSTPLAAGQPISPAAESLHQPFDDVLDLYVRDGFVYYRALKADRGKLDAYIAALDAPTVRAGYDRWPRAEQAAFWLNAYNALVLQTVVDHYPIDGRSKQYPSRSLRQVSGVFDRMRHRVAGRPTTLDEIERTILGTFRDPRMHFALGRGAIGSGRLRSEAFRPARLDSQLAQVAAEVVTRRECVRLDMASGVLSVSPIVSWYEAEFVAAYVGNGGAPRYAGRKPIERALIAFIEPELLPGEIAFLDKNLFRVEYQPFDWRLNDLTGGARP